jgi:predicted dinucleotide-binding enzyme
MKIGVLGTGMVGIAIASKLVELGHDVMMGAREATNEKATAWVTKGVTKGKSKRKAGTFADAAMHGAILVNATRGSGSIAALDLAGTGNLDGKVLLDVSNPLDFSNGLPPTLTVCNTDSLGEQIQRAFPQLKVVKTLNTVNAGVMVAPRTLPQEHTVFVAGNDNEAKKAAAALLKEFGWRDAEIVDAGPIQASRGLESWLLLWVSLVGALGTPLFNLRLVKAG